MRGRNISLAQPTNSNTIFDVREKTFTLAFIANFDQATVHTLTHTYSFTKPMERHPNLAFYCVLCVFECEREFFIRCLVPILYKLRVLWNYSANKALENWILLLCVCMCVCMSVCGCVYVYINNLVWIVCTMCVHEAKYKVWKQETHLYHTRQLTLRNEKISWNIDCTAFKMEFVRLCSSTRTPLSRANSLDPFPSFASPNRSVRLSQKS